MTVTASDSPVVDPPDDPTGIDELFDELAHASDTVGRQRCRRRIITACVPIADRIARRFAGRGEPSDDLLQVARLGLIQAVDRYEPGRGPFLSFAVPTIRGELRRHFRDKTWTVRVPRRLQETQLRARDAVASLSQRLNRSPTVVELAEELHTDPDEVVAAQGATWAYQPVSLDGAARPDGPDTVGSLHGAEDPEFERVENLMVIHDAVAELDPRRRAVVGMIYFGGLTQREVAEQFNVSQVQISRLLRDALSRIREQLGAPLSGAL
ncbi:RNA polymerase subunit sigma-70 [Mycolicibacterium duvalii]|uniref:RNA polymerase sigma factor n=1 Tax=Mycolicibacterium duvalii TaxID=39688 RepID=A0A7I7K3U5_9MYCO|nr:SigB/SigF/SigG family RNA polymerase sigma factor [Mycolicibacterium duvalii]MCV7367665.1 SigB/SigF/SigG family RNA polymerase sigma factor [Mycolicibacterium duvalii]PEG35107.1 RNA polymerase subunit sigma-70 [Mycolicibacterium duvalii]BBX18745.1 RNA polymerase sigma factor [Mycolicibacterium duvalii]